METPDSVLRPKAATEIRIGRMQCSHHRDMLRRIAPKTPRISPGRGPHDPIRTDRDRNNAASYTLMMAVVS